ncbi:MAG: DUF2953 domain-containing protein [Bacillus sp. (in: firmicutes)]
MIWVLLIVSLLLLLFLLIIFSKLTILLNYYHFNDNDDLKVEFRLWFGLIKYKIDVPLIKIDDDSPSIVVKRKKRKGKKKEENNNVSVNQIDKDDVMTSFENTKELLEHVFGLHKIVRKFFKKVSIKKFEWHSMVGLGDAAFTGMITGGIWAIKGSIIGLLSHYLSLKVMPELSVTPHFQAAVIQIRFTGIFQFRIGHAILAGLKLIKFWKGGKPHFKKKAKFSNEKTNSV